MLACIGAALSAHDAYVTHDTCMAAPQGVQCVVHAAAAEGARGARRQPSVVDVQILRAGQLLLLCVPAELTTMAGRRLREAVHARARAHARAYWVMCRLQLLPPASPLSRLSYCVGERDYGWGVGELYITYMPSTLAP